MASRSVRDEGERLRERRVGDRLAFGTATGNVYWSDDRGERRRCLGHHFPAVPSLRLA